MRCGSLVVTVLIAGGGVVMQAGCGGGGGGGGTPASTAPASTVTIAEQPMSMTVADGQAAILSVRATAAVNQTSMAVGRDGRVYLWGSFRFGFGPDATARLSPEALVAPSGVRDLALTYDFLGAYPTAFAISNSGQLQSWSPGGTSQLGRSAATFLEPGAVVVPSAVRTVAARGSTVAALLADGSVWTWGRNEDGALGIGVVSPANFVQQTPLQVAGLTSVVELAAGMHFLARLASGGLMAWGGNQYGQVGNGGFGVATSPVAVSAPQFVTPTATQPLGAIESIGADGVNSTMTTSDGRVFAWGYNSTGQLGLPVGQFVLGLAQPREVAGLSTR